MDVFIQTSSELLQAYPSTTVSVTYANASKKTKKLDKLEKPETDSRKATNLVKFKCFEPNLGKCIKYSTYKVKELSRLLTYLGPRGVSMKRKNEDEESSEKRQKLNLGVASVMSNSKFEEPVAAAEEAPEIGTPVPEEKESTPQPSKKKKKKGKKK